MKTLWKERWFNSRNWIFDHLEDLAITAEESLVILLIDFMNEHHIAISHAALAEKLKVGNEVIDEILTNLVSKGFLQIEYQEGVIQFDISKVFEEEKESSSNLTLSLFELYESEFGRTLSQIEVQRLSDWLHEYDQKMIGYALREALTYDHKNFDYIERILQEWKRKGLSVEEYEEGKR